MKLTFDSQHNPLPMTLVLAKKDGTKLGALPAHHLKVAAEFNSVWNLEFSVYKKECVGKLDIWDDIVDFKLLWLKEFDLWFEIHVQTGDGNVCVKHVSAKSLGEAELSQTKVFNLEVNTETDIERDDYKPTVFYDTTDKSSSLLDRILSKAPHYSITVVQSSLRNIQRTFSFNGTSIYEALQEVSQEISCYFDFAVHSDENGKPKRAFKVYDLQSYCLECGARGEFKDICEECGSENVVNGYGNDTQIFVSTRNLTDEVLFETNEDSVKNCFKLESGDELMDATIVNCNPNGSGYLWYIPEFMKKDMPDELVAKIEDYDELFEYYQNEHVSSLGASSVTQYNALIAKYLVFNTELSSIPSSIVGFPALMNEYYNTIDFKLLLQSSLMPSIETIETTAAEQASRLTASRLSPVAVYSIGSASKSTVDSAVLAIAKAQVDYRYQVKVISSSYSAQTWTGSFAVTNYYDEEDSANSPIISVSIVDTYETYVEQMLDKSLSNTTDYATDIVAMFKLGDTEFKAELKKYSLSRLMAFDASCEACLNILIEQGAANRDTWSSSADNLYDDLYTPYRNKRQYIQTEIQLRESEIAIVEDIQTQIATNRGRIQNALNFEEYLGTNLWLTFIAYRREDVYSNPNYISDGLDNAELFNRALRFIQVAKEDLYKSANLQHSLSATLKNLLVMKDFDGLTDNFELGNFIHIQCDDKIYDVRLLTFEIDYDNLDELPVTFSDVHEISDAITDIKNVLDNSKSIASSYDNVAHQAEQGNNSRKQLDDCTTNGLALTDLKIVNSAENQDYVFDEHGMLFRKYLPLSGTYSDEQLKIINSTMAITNDNWVTVKTAVGAHYYIDPLTNELTYAYGINGEVLIGKIILGEQLGIYNSGATLQFNKNGLTITNDVTTFKLNPNTTENIMTVQVKNNDVLRVSKDGLYITGEVVATAGTIGGLKITNNKLQIGLSDVSGLNNSISTLNTAISTVEREAKAYADGAVSSLRDTVEANYSTLNTAISTVEREAKAYADGAVASLKMTTSVNGKSATLTMTATDKDGSIVSIDADTITFTSVALTSDIPTKISELTNDSGYQNRTGVVSIVNGTVTADFVNALGITAGAILIKNSNGYELLKASGTTVNIGNFTVGRDYSRSYICSNSHSSLSDTAYAGVYIGTDGISIYGKGGANYMKLDVANGNFEFKGKITATSGTFSGSLNAATGTFAGNLSAAGGTFSGTLSAASGSFSGTVNATGGSIAGWVIGWDNDLNMSIVRSPNGIYGKITWSDTGTNLTWIEGYIFSALTQYGLAYVVKETSSYSSKMLGCFSCFEILGATFTTNSGGSSGWI